MFSNGQITTYGSSFDELLCTKDSDWRFQDEWRIISNPGSSVKLRAKAVYLGFDVSHENEEQMKQCSLKNNFILYKMDNPIGVKKIVYSKIN